MTGLLKKQIIFIFVVMFCLFSGCAYLDNNDDEDDFVEDFSLYEAGSPVTALGYAETIPIILYIKAGKEDDGTPGHFKILSNGEYVEAGTHTLGVKVAPRKVDGAEVIQRVYVSDGGWAYQVEAIYDDSSGYYICDFNFFDTKTYVVHPILVKVIYPLEKKALKEKFVVTTYPGLRPDTAMLVEKGLGLALSANAMNSVKDTMAVFLGDSEGLEIRGLTPAINKTDDEKGVFHLDLGLGPIPVSLDLALNDTYTDNNGEKVRALGLGLEDLSGGEPENIVEFFTSLLATGVLGIFGDPVINLFNLDEIPIMPVSFPISTMLAGFGGSDDGGESDDPMAGLLENLNLGSTLFLNIYGMPEFNEENFAVIGGSLYATDASLVKTDVDGNTCWIGWQV